MQADTEYNYKTNNRASGVTVPGTAQVLMVMDAGSMLVYISKFILMVFSSL